MRRVTEAISEGFIWGVGITRPKAGQERRAGLFITAMLIGTVAVILGLFAFVVTRI
jgi:hypothetical protein